MAFNVASSSVFCGESSFANLHHAQHDVSSLIWERAMPGKRRGIIAPQNTFLENVIRKTTASRVNFVLANAHIDGYPIVYASDGFCSMVGRQNKAEVLSKSGLCDFLYGTATDPAAAVALRDACACRSAVQHIDILLYRLDGTPFWSRIQAAQIKDENNEAVLLLLTFKENFSRPVEGDSRLRRFARFAKGIVRKESHDPNAPIQTVGSFRRTTTSDNCNNKVFDNLRQYRQETPNIPPFIIPHYGNFKNVWDWMMLLLTTYTSIMVPVNVAFSSKTMDNTILLTTDAYVDLVFFVDLILNFRTTFVGKSREVIFESKAIRANYLKKWFVIDLLSCLPYDAMFSFTFADAITHSSILNGLKVFRLLRIGRVVRKLDQYLEAGGAVLLLLVLCFLLVSHWLACIWYSIGCRDLANGIQYGWISELHAKTLSNEYARPKSFNDTEPDKIESYVTALYFVVTCTTAVGFGNVAANTELEKLFSLFSMAIGAMMFATIFGNITTIFQQMFIATARYHDMMNHIKSFIDLHDIPFDLADKILDYVTSRWSITKGVDQDKVLLYCPQNMKGDICVHLNRDIFNSNPAFLLASEACLRALAVHVIIEHHAPGDTLMRQGEIIDSLFFVVTGTLEVIQDDQIIALLVKGDVFGNAFWEHRNFKQSACTVKTLTYATVHSIKSKKFLEVLDVYPVFARSFQANMTISVDLHKKWQLQRSAEPTVILEASPAAHSHNHTPMNSLFDRFRRISQETLINLPLINLPRMQRRSSERSINRLSVSSDCSRPSIIPLPRLLEEEDSKAAKRLEELRLKVEREELAHSPTSLIPTPTVPIRGICENCGTDMRRMYDLQIQMQQVVTRLMCEVDETVRGMRSDFSTLDIRVGRNEEQIGLLFSLLSDGATKPIILDHSSKLPTKSSSSKPQSQTKQSASFAFPRAAIAMMESFESAVSSTSSFDGS